MDAAFSDDPGRLCSLGGRSGARDAERLSGELCRSAPSLDSGGDLLGIRPRAGRVDLDQQVSDLKWSVRPAFQIGDKGLAFLKAGMARMAAAQLAAPIESLPQRLGISRAVDLDHPSPPNASELAQVGRNRTLGSEVAFDDQREARSEEAIDAEAEQSSARTPDPH